MLSLRSGYKKNVFSDCYLFKLSNQIFEKVKDDGTEYYNLLMILHLVTKYIYCSLNKMNRWFLILSNYIKNNTLKGF